MPAELTAFTLLVPIAVFLIVVAVVFAILNKTKLLGENVLAQLVFGFLVATVFVSAGGAVRYVGTIVPWFAVVIVSAAFIFALTGFLGDNVKSITKPIGIIIVIILGLAFLVSAFLVFSNVIVGYLPGPNFGRGIDEGSFLVLDWLYSPRVAGAVILIIASVIVSWVLYKSGGGKK